MATISPDYKSRQGVPNPYYTMDRSVLVSTKNALKKNGIDVKGEDIFFKAVHKISGKLIVQTSGKTLFQLALSKDEDLQYGIRIAQSKVTGHLGMKSRKDSTASSNVNEFLTVYYLLHKCATPEELHQKSCSSAKSPTGVLTGEGNPVTYEQLCMLIDKDETPDRDIKIGMNNAEAVKKDIKGRTIEKLYWVPRGKPPGISPKTPSDVIIEFNDGTFQGYSNKITKSGKDDTPKFNTNIYAFYGKLEDSKQQGAIGKIIDTAWNDAVKDVKKPTAKAALDSVDIGEEAFSETKSREVFATLASNFRLDQLDFYKGDFYWPFRNNLIKGFIKHLEDPINMVYFLNTIYFYTYDDPRSTYTPCPYKLLIGKEKSASTIKDVSENEELKEVLFNKKPKRIQNIRSEYDGTSQSFVMYFKFNGFNVKIPVTCRTRAQGGWAGKSLFITTPGVKIV